MRVKGHKGAPTSDHGTATTSTSLPTGATTVTNGSLSHPIMLASRRNFQALSTTFWPDEA